MRGLLALCLGLLLLSCQKVGSRAFVIILDDGFGAELLATSRDGFTAPDGLLWHDGVLYMADEGGSAIRSWRSGAAPRTLAAGAGIASPEDLVRDSSGNIYFTDDDRGGVWRIDGQGRYSPLTAAHPGLRSTEAIALTPSGDLLVGDQANHQILRVTPQGQIQTFLGPRAGIAKPESMAFDTAGNLYIADNRDDVLYLLTREGRLHTPIRRQPGFSPESLWYAEGGLYITDSKHRALHRYTPEDGLRTIALFTGELENVQGITSDGRGNLYISVQSDLAGGRGYIVRLTRVASPNSESGLRRPRMNR